jgi:hypothetical protein
MRAGFAVVCPHPDPLPEGEGEKLYALFVGRISNPSWEKIALLKIEQDRKTERVHYVIEFFPFAYRNLEQAQTTRDGDVRSD